MTGSLPDDRHRVSTQYYVSLTMLPLPMVRRTGELAELAHAWSDLPATVANDRQPRLR